MDVDVHWSIGATLLPEPKLSPCRVSKAGVVPSSGRVPCSPLLSLVGDADEEERTMGIMGIGTELEQNGIESV